MMQDLLDEGVITVEQYNAITDTSNEVLCLACAGSGKSRALAFRIARLINEGATPQSIVAFTFTEKAAESLKRRVADALDRCGIPIAIVGAMYIGTIHAYCQSLLSQMDARYGQFEVLDENRLKLFLLSRFYDLGLREVQESKDSFMFRTIAEVSNAWKIANDELLGFNDIEIRDGDLGRCLRNIHSRLDQDQYLDFSLMIRLTVDALRANNPEINRALNGVKHLMVDEYQDVNPSQEALISEVYRRIDTLFVVGDDDQSIYGWRGADVRNIIDFDQRYRACSSHTLSTNFRSTSTIVETADRFIQMELGPTRISKNPTSNSDGNISHFGNLWFETKSDEANWIAQRITDLIGTKYVENDQERGLTRSDFAILMRSVQGGTRNGGAPYHREYTAALADQGIQYLIEAEGSIFERPHALTVRGSMELLRDPGVERQTVISYFNQNVSVSFPNANLNQFIDVIARWNNDIHRPSGGARRKVYPQKLVHELLNAFNVSTTDFENQEQVLRDLGVFSAIMLDVEKVFISVDSDQRYRTVLNFLKNVAETGYDTTSVELMARPDAITVSTVHKMKGLEFPVVFLVDVVNQRFPGRRQGYSGWLPNDLLSHALANGLYQNDNAGEARLFYTALTRAERFLYITGSANQPQLARPKKPSPFKLRINEVNHQRITADPYHMPENLDTSPPRPRVNEESMPTSFTEIKDYLECPMKYKFRKIYGFSPAVPELFGFGLTTHTAIGRLHQLFPDTAPSTQDARDITDQVFHLKHVFQSNDPARPGPYERAREASKRVIGNYTNDYPEDFMQSRSLEQRFEIKAGRALITGAIDLLLREDDQGNILEAKVIDFKSMELPDERVSHFWINLSLQVQLYAHAAHLVLSENARTGAVHLLKERNTTESPNRVDIPINSEALNAAINNVKWAVDRVLEGEFPMRPSASKCGQCDFNLICARNLQEFTTETRPERIHIPNAEGVEQILAGCFSDID